MMTLWKPNTSLPAKSGWYLVRRTHINIQSAFYNAVHRQWEIQGSFHDWTEIPD